MKRIKIPTLKPGEINVLTGEQLIELGERKTADGSLISTKSVYEVLIKMPKWVITLKY